MTTGRAVPFTIAEGNSGAPSAPHEATEVHERTGEATADEWSILASRSVCSGDRVHAASCDEKCAR